MLILVRLLVLGTFLTLVFNATRSPTPLNLLATQLAFFVYLGIWTYARIRNREPKRPTTKAPNPPRRNRKIGAGYAYLFAVSAAAYFLWNSLYVPSLYYYYAVSLAVALVGLQILLRPESQKRGTSLILLQIVTIGVLIRLSYPLLNPKSVFSDPYFHWTGIEILAQSGKIPDAIGYYLYYPYFHALNTVAVNVAAIGISSYLLFNSLLIVLAVLGSFLLAREIVSPRLALACALLLLISLFFFLIVTVAPALMSANLMIFALYALLRYRRTASRKFWAIFWLISLFVFFSHPASALVLAAILVVFWFNGRLRIAPSEDSKITGPTATYGVAYLAYLGFIAFSAFTFFFQSLFESGPNIHFARSAVGTVPGQFIAQVIASTLGFTILFLPATFAILFWLFEGSWNRRFIIGVLFVLAAVPAVMVLTGRGAYGLQAARTLPYLSIFIVFPAAFGMFQLTQRLRRNASKTIAIVLVLFLLAFLSSTSYLTGGGIRVLSDAIPVSTSHSTDSMLAVRSFLEKVPEATPLTLDPELGDFLAPYGSGLGYLLAPYPIVHSNLAPFPFSGRNASAAIAVSDLYLSHGGYATWDTSSLEILYGVRAYDNGMVRVYVPFGEKHAYFQSLVSMPSYGNG